MEVNSEIIQRQITFLGLKVVKTYFLNDKPFRHNLPEDLSFGLGYIIHFFSDNPRSFIVEFRLKFESKEKDFILEVIADASFETQKPIDEKFKNSEFVKINAPAISFPFVRTFISNFTLNSGIPPLILPSINFTKLSPKQVVTH